MARSSKEYVIAPYGNTFAMYETMKLKDFIMGMK